MPRGSKVVILVRHGECVTNTSLMLSSDHDVGGLTEKGAAQARAVAGALSPYAPKIASLHTSPVVRAMQTAAEIGDVLGVGPKIDRRLTERGMGSLNRMTFHTREEMVRRYKQAAASGDEGVEEWGTLVSRMKSFFDDLAPGVHVAVTHYDPVVAAASIIDEKYGHGRFYVPNASLTVLDYPDEVLSFGARELTGRRFGLLP